MKMRRAVTLVSFLLLGLGCVSPCRATADEVVVVLGSDSQPYQEALAGVKESYGTNVQVISFSKGDVHISEGTRVIVAIGGKAALYSYNAPQAVFIYCVAPQTYADPLQHPAGMTKVHISPPPDILLQKLRDLQPSLKRLQSFWVSDLAINYQKPLKEEGDKIGVTVSSEHLKSLEELPDRLRAIKGRVDAFWLPPDPLLITPQSFAMIRQFSWDNNIPLYVSMDALADQGAAASVGVSFREQGRKAGSLVTQALSSHAGRLGSDYYGEKILVTINLKSAAKAGLSIPAEVSKRADRLVP